MRKRQILWKRKGEAVEGTASTLALHFKRQKHECGAIYRKIHDKALLFNKPAYAKKSLTFVVH